MFDICIQFPNSFFERWHIEILSCFDTHNQVGNISTLEYHLTEAQLKNYKSILLQCKTGVSVVIGRRLGKDNKT